MDEAASSDSVFAFPLRTQGIGGAGGGRDFVGRDWTMNFRAMGTTAGRTG